MTNGWYLLLTLWRHSTVKPVSDGCQPGEGVEARVARLGAPPSPGCDSEENVTALLVLSGQGAPTVSVAEILAICLSTDN